MNTLEKDINFARAVIRDEIDYTTIFSKIYSFSNENLVECLKNFNLKNKCCLTVMASADQTLDMYLGGAKSVTTFDINPITKYYYNLKRAALISRISLEEYINFFNANMSYRGNPFNKDTFYKIAENLDSKCLIFWKDLFEEFDNNIISDNLFYFDPINNNVIKNNINYLSTESNYNKLQEIIMNKEIDFIHADIKYLYQYLNNKFDFMYFSNIMSYANLIFDTRCKGDNIEALKKYKLMVSKLAKKLNKNGNIMVDYIFFTYNFFNIQKVFNDDEYSCIKFKNDSDKIDSCLIYTKNY